MRLAWPGIGYRKPKESPESGPEGAESEPEPKQPVKRRESDRDLLALVAERRDAATRRLQDYLPEIAIGLAYEDGNQWVEWQRDADGRGRLVDNRTAEQVKAWRACNLMRPMILTNVARFTSGRPDVIVTPQSTAKLDRQATEEARAVLDWYNDRLNLRDALRRLTHYNQVATTAFERFWWDDTKDAAVPGEGSFQPEAEDDAPPLDPMAAPALGDDEATGPSGYVESPVGDLCSDIVLGHQVLIDPRAKRWADRRWVIVDEVMPSAEVKERYGVSLPGDGTRRDVLRNISETSLTSRWFNDQMPAKSVNVATMYEEPSERFPDGRTVVCTDDVVLAYEESLPCGVTPLVPLGYQERIDSCYARGLAADAAQPQYNYNLTRAHMSRGVSMSTKIVLSREAGDGAGKDIEEMFEEGPGFVTLYHLPGKAAPQFTPPQFNLDACLAALDFYSKEMADLLGVHIVSSGQGDPNARSGYAIRLLQDSDRTMHAPYVQAIERFVEDRARMILRFAGHYVQEPRVWGLDDTDNPQDAEMRVSSLPALRAGGAVAVKVIEASGTPRTPEAMDEEILGLFGQGLAGDPMDPATRKSVLESLQSPAATRLKEAVEKALEEFPMAPPEPPAPPTDPMGAMPQDAMPTQEAAPATLPEMDPMMAAAMAQMAPPPVGDPTMLPPL